LRTRKPSSCELGEKEREREGEREAERKKEREGEREREGGRRKERMREGRERERDVLQRLKEKGETPFMSARGRCKSR